MLVMKCSAPITYRAYGITHSGLFLADRSHRTISGAYAAVSVCRLSVVCNVLLLLLLLFINEQINVALSPKTTSTVGHVTYKKEKKRKKTTKTTCSVDRPREQRTVEQRLETSVRHCEQVRL